MPRTSPSETKLKRIKSALNSGFESAAIEADIRITKGFGDNVHIRVVSPAFRELSWREREELIWGMLEKDLKPQDQRTISLLMLESPEEAAPDYEELRKRHERLRVQVKEAMGEYIADRTKKRSKRSS